MSDNTERSTSARALSALTASRRPRSHRNSPAPSIASSDDASTFNPDNDDALMSTKHHIDEDDSHFLPKIRTTAQGRRYYNPVQVPNVPSSAVRREFGDFDHGNSTDGEEDSIEVGRGIGNTPSKPNKSLDSEILMEIGNSTFVTPPSKMRNTPKSNLRKEASLRRASSTRVPAASGYGKPSKENNAPQQAEEQTRPTRFTNRTVSANNDSYQRPLGGTPQRVNGTPRGIANSTAQSFLLPDVGNLTELFGASINNGTPNRPREGFSNRRIMSAYNGRVPSNYYSVAGVPIPADEKQIIASLEMLRDRLQIVEQEKEEAHLRIEEYEMHVADLQAQIDAQANMRRSDSALGSSDGEGAGAGKNKWKIEKAQLEASVASFQRRLEQADRKVSLAEAATKRVTSERDSLATQLSVAYYNNEELKGENEVVQNENRILQDQVADLQSENRALTAEVEELRSQFDHSHERHEDETQRWQQKEAALNRKANTNDRAILNENQTLRNELVRAREQQQEAERKAARRETKARREAERAAEAEHAQLMAEKEQLLAELESAKASHEAELKRWTSKQAELQAHIDQREETIHQLRVAVPQDEINDDLRRENQELKAELAGLKATCATPATRIEEQGTPKDVLRKRLEEVTNQHVQDGERWEKREARLQGKLEKVREVNELYRKLDEVRADTRTAASKTDAKIKRRSTGQIDAGAQETLRSQTAMDYTHTHSRSKSQSRRISRPVEPSHNHRHVSAPITTATDDAADLGDSSTTDLSFDPAILAGAPHSGGKGKRATGFVPVQQHTGDTTFLSLIEGNQIEQLRKRIEEEHLAKRQREAAAAEVEKEVTGYGVRRRSFTARSRASSRARSVLSMHNDADDESAIEETTAAGARKDDTLHSRTSRASHRRRSSAAAFTEMTSAFIIPDITMHTHNGTTKDILSSLKAAAHDTKSCSICQRILSSSPVDVEDLTIPAPVPVTTRAEYKNDIDATLRPAQAPASALARVVKELSDELQHLKLEFSVLSTRLRASDPALGKRKSDALHAKIARLNKAIAVKEGQLYALFDVVEAHKHEFQGVGGDEEVLPEEVERTLENVLEARDRRVGFERGSEDGEGEGEGSEWPGISDTEGM